MQNIVNFRYQTPAGRPGEVTLNLDMIIPASAANFKKVMSFVNMAYDQETPARVIYDYIADHVNALKKARELAKGTPREKEETAKINTEMKRWIANAAPLVQAFGFPEITDKDATIRMKKATVYALQGKKNRGANADIAVCDGWTFEKDGILFDVYQAGPKNYIILYHGTGLQVASATNKTGAPVAVDARIMGILTDPRGAGKIKDAKDYFATAMIAAGYMDAEPAPAEPEPEQEKELDTNAGPLYGTDGNEKHFIGTVITGHGWKIRFTPERTAVIFDRMPPVAYRNAVKAAGFKWAPTQKSWNKGATWKAYRAALQLAEQLKALAA